jgi:hypothetical protein
VVWLNPRDLWLWENAQGGTDAPITTIAKASYVILEGRTEFDIPHTFLTPDVIPVFTPSWMTNVWPIQITDTNIRVKFSVPSPKPANLDFAVTRGTRATVTAGAETYVITHNLNDATAVVLVTAGWNTTVYSISKAANVLTVGFSAPPFYNAYIYWSTHAESDDLAATETIPSGTETYIIEHNAGRPYLPVFVLPSWNARMIKYTDKIDENRTLVSFSNAPSGSGSLDRRVKYV